MAEHKVVLTGVDTGKLVALSPSKTRELLISYRNGDSSKKEELSVEILERNEHDKNNSQMSWKKI